MKSLNVGFRFNMLTVLIACALLWLGGIAQAQGKTTGSIAGVISEAEGKPLAEVTIRAKNQSTGTLRSAQSDAEGNYRVADLVPGWYEVAFVKQGHETKVITLNAGAETQLNLPLEASSYADLTHYHILLNHVPTIGTILGLGLLIVALLGKSDDLRRASLTVFVVIALISILTYATGNSAYERIQSRGDVSKTLVRTHEGAALVAMAAMEVTGAFAWLGLWSFRRTSKIANWNLALVLVLALAAFGLMARAANIGGEIRHPEIRVEQETTIPEGPLGRTVGAWVTASPWVWPSLEALHFIGLTLLIGICLLIDMRILGAMKGVAFATLHRLLPWGVLGFAINTLTGMLFFVSAPEQYIKNVSFHAKLVLLLLAGVNALYFTIIEEPWTLGPGDEAPALTKTMAASLLLLWVAVMYFGSMLPFIGNAF